jgi:glycosyltransferase involved in cell wall biosynthesis
MSADLHVLHVFSSAGLYGAEHAVLGLIPALAACGVQSTLACIDNPYFDEQPLYQRAYELGIPARRIRCSGRLDGTTTRELRTVLQQHHGAIMHVHGYKSAFYALRARHGCPGTPVVSTLHGWVTNTRALWLYRMLELWMLRRIDRVCIVAESMRQPLREAGIPAERIALVENGIDTARFRPDGPTLSREELGIARDAFVFGGVLRMSSEKNPLGLLDAFMRVARQMPHAWLVVAGDGAERDAFEQRARASGFGDRIRLLGKRSDTERIYPLFDCFVLPSLTEGLPLALLEAMACELPIVATRVGQVATVLEDLPVELVAPGDAAGLANAMLDALSRHPPLPSMRQRVLARYSVARMARDYTAVYSEVREPDVDQVA